MTPEKTVILVAGPTAVGKTALSVQLSGYLGGVPVISADSRQCYRELNIGVARPSLEELNQVQHYFVASHSVEEAVNAATFEQYALDAVHDIFTKQDTALLSGGTGLYVKAFWEGLDMIPTIPEAIRATVRENYKGGGIAWLQAELQQKDPLGYPGTEAQNPHRLMRSLEVLLATGQPIRHFHSGNTAVRQFHFIKIGLDLPRATLYERINARVDQMMENGLLEEVRSLVPLRHCNALDTVGYKELFAYLDGNMGLDAAIALIKQNTRHYAKRQITWFRKDPEMTWFDPGEGEQVLTFVRDRLTAARHK